MSLNTRDDHLDFLTYLEHEVELGSVGRAINSPEGAFWFGDLSLSEYASKYREQCIKEGWMDE